VRGRRCGDVLAFSSLLMRPVSSVVACRSMLESIGNRLAELVERCEEDHEARRQGLRTLRDDRRRLERSGALVREEEDDQAQLEANDMAAETARTGARDGKGRRRGGRNARVRRCGVRRRTRPGATRGPCSRCPVLHHAAPSGAVATGALWQRGRLRSSGAGRNP
jgi:hypothetical protein